MREEIDEILGERQEEYGDPAPNFVKTGRVWGALLGLPDIPAYQVALMMDAFKSVRIMANPDHLDSWNDKIGYSLHGKEIVRRKNVS
jgi:hypothetical protein